MNYAVWYTWSNGQRCLIALTRTPEDAVTIVSQQIGDDENRARYSIETLARS